jgi:hypothetical protein
MERRWRRRESEGEKYVRRQGKAIEVNVAIPTCLNLQSV